MSVINDMLRDLDKRQAPEVSDTDAKRQESLIEPATPWYKKWLIIVPVLVVLSVLVLVGFFGGDSEPKPLSTADSQPAELVNSVEHDIRQAKELSETKAEVSQTQASVELAQKEALPRVSEEDSTQEKLTDSAEVIDNVQMVKVPIVEDKLSDQRDSHIQERPKVSVGSHTDKKPVDQNSSQPEKEELKSSENQTQQALSKAEQAPSEPVKSVKKPQPVTRNISPPRESVTPKRLEIEDNTMTVSLSPVALDVQMAENAMKLISQHRDAEAYRQLYAFIGAHDVDTESRTVLASYLLQEGRIAEVGDVLLNAPINESPKLRQIKARWYAAQGEQKLALYTLSSNLPALEQHTDYYVLLAAYYQRLGWTKEASETYALLLEYDDNVADWWAGLGLATDRNNEKDKAMYAYQQALELNGLSTELFNFVEPRLQQLRAHQSAQ